MDGDPRPEAPLAAGDGGGLVPGGPGWFVLNAAEAQWFHNPEFGDACIFESRAEGSAFEHYGFNLRVLEPGQPNCRYHGESGQEDFLVLAGECIALVEGQELRLGPWDFLHCPPGTLHVFVGAGEGPCLILMAGARPQDETLFYPADPLAAAHGASAAADTADPREAYAGCTRSAPRPPRAETLPRLPPGGLTGLATVTPEPRRLQAGPGRPPAALEPTPRGGLLPSGPGWFVVNAGATRWLRLPEYGEWCSFEGTGEAGFPQLGINLHMVLPGQPNCRYHGETAQEGFLVLHGECVLVVEGRERRLRAWDYAHFPSGTKHVVVGAGDGPCLLAMAGARPEEGSILYPLDPVAQRWEACAAQETDDPAAAYAGSLPRFEVQPRHDLLPRWTVAAGDGGLGGDAGAPGAGQAGATP